MITKRPSLKTIGLIAGLSLFLLSSCNDESDDSSEVDSGTVTSQPGVEAPDPTKDPGLSEVQENANPAKPSGDDDDDDGDDDGQDPPPVDQFKTQYAYVTSAGAGANEVFLFALAADGSLTPLSTPSVVVGSDPYDLASDPLMKNLYVANSNSNTMSQFSIDPATGLLDPLTPATVSQATTPYGIAFTPDGEHMYAANGNSGDIAQYARATTGELSSLTPGTVAAGTNTWFVATDPAGKYLFATDYGNNGATDDLVYMYTIDQTTGALTPNATPSIPCEDRPWYIASHPSGKFVYLTNYGSDSVSKYSLNQSTGLLTSLGTTPVGSQPIGLTMTKDGKYLYVANSTGNSISMFAVDESTGDLTPIGAGTIYAGASPYGLMVDHKNKFLYAAIPGDNEIRVYVIDPTDGSLSAHGTPTVSTGTTPRFITIVGYP